MISSLAESIQFGSSAEDIVEFFRSLPPDETIEYLFDLAKNTTMSEPEMKQCLQEIFRYFHSLDQLDQAIYEWLDGWDDYWSISPDRLVVRMFGSIITRRLVSESRFQMSRELMIEFIPFLGEKELYSFYKNQIKNDFQVSIEGW
jgi:hypothetical protein